MTEPQFIHLRVHSDFSMIDGMHKIPKILQQAVTLEQPAIAITDQMNLCGLVRFYQKAQQLGVKPIIGADLWVNDSKKPELIFRLTALAQSATGYKNLTLLISQAYQRGQFQYKPVIDTDWLWQYNEGLILLSGAKQGDLGQALLRQDLRYVQQQLPLYQRYFPDRFYIELIRTQRQDEPLYTELAVQFAAQHDLPIVATNESCFLQESEFSAHEIRVAIHDGYTLGDVRRPKNYSDQQYLKSTAQMQALFHDLPEALTNSVEIAKRCTVDIRLDEYFLPQFPTGDLSTKRYLIQKSEEGLEKRLQQLFPDPTIYQQQYPSYSERLAIELEVINNMGFPGYFLIVMEFIHWSKQQHIPVGPGRGSGAGSLVAYALEITDLDPLQFDLLFERFLNPERVSMPDFDIDFCMDRRDEVIDHVAELYGRDAVSQIITFGTMASKAVIRDVGRVLDHPYGFIDRIAKLIPLDPGMTLAKAFEQEPELERLYQTDDDVHEIIDYARQLEGVIRNAGKHAGGVVIAPTKITDFSPLYCDDDGNNPVTQFDKNDVETAGLVKFDFLGLRTLTILQWAVDMVNVKRQKKQQSLIDITSIPLNDNASFKRLKNCETTAVFQLESRGMKDLVRRLQPDTFEDIIALVALFRPGPLQSGMVDNFIDRKHGHEEISYPDAEYQHDSLQTILDPTYGIILYQEQVMQIAQVLAGYSLGGADLLRRAMGKKKPEEMAKQREVFKQGAIENNVDGVLAMRIFDLVEKFAGYGFNKSHSAAYALVSYQTLWMKTHFPAEFMAAVLSADIDNTDKIVSLIDECRRLQLIILPPDVNNGQFKFTVNDKGEIVYGLGAIKGVGEAPVEVMIAAREQQPFDNLFDFCCRTDYKKVNRRTIEKLILAGAFDRLSGHRAQLLASIETAIKTADQQHKGSNKVVHDLFGVYDLAGDPERTHIDYVDVAVFSDKVRLQHEKETLGLYLTGHPIDHYQKELPHFRATALAHIKPTAKDGSTTVLGLIIQVRTLLNKQNKRWAIVTLDDKSARVDIRFFPEQFEYYADVLTIDQIVRIRGAVQSDRFTQNLMMNAAEVTTIDKVRESLIRHIKIPLTQQQITPQFLRQLTATLTPYKQGNCPIIIDYARPDCVAHLQLGAEWAVTPNDQCLADIDRLVINSELVYH